MDVFPELIQGALHEAARAAAHELGLFDALPCPALALSDRLHVRPRRLGALVRALILDGTVEQSDGILRAPSMPERRPVPSGGWGKLADVIRSDRPLPEATTSVELKRFHDHLRCAGVTAAREVAELLDPPGPLLDLGGGAGAYAAAFLAAHPGERAIIVDRPAVLELAREAVPAAERIALDLLADEPEAGRWPRGAHIALLANVLHLYGPADAARLVSRAASAVVPGGTVAIKDFDASSPIGILFSLNMALFTAAGEVHDATRLCSFLSDAGVRDIRIDRLRSVPEALLVSARTL